MRKSLGRLCELAVPHPPRFRPLAFWLGCFAMLMMQLGPVLSGAQSVMAVGGPESVQLASAADHDHADHKQHALMGHFYNPQLPDWVNNLQMCGYCDLLTLSPALLLALVLALGLRALRLPAIVWRQLVVYVFRLWTSSAPRAPPIFA